ncbi:Putative membrane protein [Criblamydia sequanensis CRIB-18]|uniref:Membrane protein n=1 Tax=Candidatus Criblamydia sequanensis CRIB-18 TaxID=1437425 RepID=A0A090D2W7_9BACT|nr:Putative membrane protein [Criblamydia sequanensis CRIB-18]
MKLSNSINFLFIFLSILLGQGFNSNKIWSVDLNMDNMQSLGLRINLYSESIFCTMGMNYVGCAFFME